MPVQRTLKVVAIFAIASLALPALAQARSKKASPNVAVLGWSTAPLGSGRVISGQTLRMCGTVADQTKKLYVYLRFRGLRKGRKATIKWTVNGLTYATAENEWALGTSGKAQSDLGRATTHARFLSGLYRFSFIYGGRRLATSTLNVDTHC